MLNVICVLRSGGVYTPEWVSKLRDGVKRNLQRPHHFRCLSDVEVDCERTPLQHDWPGWWSKIELFRDGVIDSETLYLDLDTVITGEIEILRNGIDFAMLQSFWDQDMVGSGVMYFSGENVPHQVYTKFAKQPKAYIEHYERNKNGTHVGDQAFIFDTLGPDIARINDYLPGIRSYKMHCFRRLPADTSIVCFHGQPRPTEVDIGWMKQHWALTESDIA